MIGIVGGLFLIGIALLALALQRLYSSIPARELRRLAQRGDRLAKGLYRPVAYGSSLRLFLWIVLVVTLTVGLLLVTPKLPGAANFALLALVAVVSFILLPSLQLTVRTAQFAALLAGPISGILSYIHRPLNRMATLVGRYRELAVHSRLYEKEDLLSLLDLQKEQVDNRILHDEIELAARALTFEDKQAADIVQPRNKARLVNADEAIGPVLLDQLHKSAQSSFLVYKDKKENIIGSLSMRDAVRAKQGGRVLDLIRNDLTFVHEDFTLRQVLAAFQKTGQPVAVVINKFEEFLGVITLDGLLKELLGEGRPETVETYENRSIVATYVPQPIPIEETPPEVEDQPPEAAETQSASSEGTEVVK